MSELCQICGPNRSEAPLVICAPCALSDLGREKEAALSAELLYLRFMRDDLAHVVRGCTEYPGPVEAALLVRSLRRILAIGKSATGPAVATPSCIDCGSPLVVCDCHPGCPGGKCLAGCR